MIPITDSFLLSLGLKARLKPYYDILQQRKESLKSKSKASEVAVIESIHDNDAVKDPSASSSSSSKQAIKYPFTINEQGEKIYSTNDEFNIQWKGDTLDDFEFVDIPDVIKGMSFDCRYDI